MRGSGGKQKGRDFYGELFFLFCLLLSLSPRSWELTLVRGTGILGVSRQASDDELKKAFKKQAMKHHPDRNRGDEEAATAKFKDAKDAFDALSDPKKRRIYDRHGEAGLDESGGGGGGRGDMFSRFFGQDGGGEEEDDGRGEDVRLKMGVELKELFNGTVRRVPMQKQFVCEPCKGAGTTKAGAGKKCSSCGGQGMRMEMRQMGPFVTQQPVECRACFGEGVQIKPGDECKGCDGRRVVQRQAILEIPIERGLSSGDKVTLRGEASQTPGEEPGDIIIIVVEQTPPGFPFERRGDDLVCKHSITLTEALCGFKFAMKHMDGRTLVVSSQPGDVIRPGQKKVVLGEGMPIRGMPSERGRLIIEFTLDFPGPEHITDEVRTLLEKALPKAPEFVLPAEAIDNFHEHVAHDYVDREEEYGGGARGAEAYESDEGHPGGQGQGAPQCAHQ